MGKILTISIAAYNVEEFIEKTLNWLIIKEIEKVEIIVVNDGSKDRTKEIVERYVEKYPESIRLINKENGGYGSTINTSIKLATGKYFKQLDGDDWYNTKNLESLVKKLEDIDADIVYTPMITVYTDLKKEKEERELWEKISKIYNSKNIFNLKDIIELAPKRIGMHSLAYKTELLKKNNIKCLEKCFYTDTEYEFYPFLYSKSIFVFEKPIYYYRIGREGQSVSIEGLRKNYRDIIKVLDTIIARYSKEKLEYEMKDYCDKLIVSVINFLLKAFVVLPASKESFEIISKEIKRIEKKYNFFYQNTLKNKKGLSKVLYSNFSKNYIYYKILKFAFDRKNKIKN